MGIVKFEEVNVSIEGIKLLKDINISFFDKNIYLIGGANGCGKTTLLNVLAKKQKYEGNIFLDDIELRNISEEEIFGKYISYMPQDNDINNPLSLEQLVACFYPLIDGEIVESSIELLELSELYDKPLKDLSGGERQRCLITFHLLSDKPILLLDEYENNLDSEYLSVISDLISKQEKLVIIVTHMDITYPHINVVIENNNVKLENENIKRNSNDKIEVIDENIKKAAIFKLFATSNIDYHIIYLFLLAVVFIVALVAGINNIEEFHNEWMPEHEMAEVTNDTSMTVICSACDSYQIYEYIPTNIELDDMYFDYEDYETLLATNGVVDVQIIANPFATTGVGNIDGFNTKTYEYEFNGVTYNSDMYMLGYPVALIEKMPYVYFWGNSAPTYGDFPTDSTNEVMVPESMAYSYYGNDVDLKEYIGTKITLTDEEGNTQDFIISGFHNYEETKIYHSYDPTEKGITHANSYYALQEEEMAENAIKSSYSRAQDFNNDDFSIEEFMQYNPDLIEGFYIEVSDPKYLVEIEEMIWEKYPNAVIYDDNIYETHPPFNTLAPIFRNLLRKLIIIVSALFIILLVVMFSYNVQRNSIKKFLATNGVSSNKIKRAAFFETMTYIGGALFLSLVPAYFIMNEGRLIMASTILYVMLLFVIFMVVNKLSELLIIAIDSRKKD